MSVSFKVSEFGRSQKWLERFELNSNWTCPIISILKLFLSSISSIWKLIFKIKNSGEIYTVIYNQFRFTLLDPSKSPVMRIFRSILSNFHSVNFTDCWTWEFQGRFHRNWLVWKKVWTFFSISYWKFLISRLNSP